MWKDNNRNKGIQRVSSFSLSSYFPAVEKEFASYSLSVQIEEKPKDTGKISSDMTFTIDKVMEMLKEKFQTADYESAKRGREKLSPKQTEPR